VLEGRAGPEFHHDPRRFDVPMMRTAAGELVATTWDEALDDIAARLTAVVDEHGPAAVASYTGTGGPLDPSGYALAQGFFRALGSSTMYSALSVDCSGKFLVPELVAGVQLQFSPDLPATDLLLAIGINTVVSHGHGLMMPNPLGHVRDLRARGGRLVVVDPRRSETAHHADLHLAPAPGSDPALLAFAVRHVLEAGGADQAFLDACADPDGVTRLRHLVAPYTAERAAEICGVPIADLETLATMITTAGRIGIETGTGVSMGRSANVTEWLVWVLAAVTGSLDREGGCTFNPGFLRAIEDAPPGGRGDLGPRPASRPDLPRIVNGELPCAALADEIEGGAVRALIVRMGNPALAIPDPARIAGALGRLDVLVAIEAHPSPTTDVATHVLPVADHFERTDLVTGYLQATPFLRRAPAVVEPLAQRRPQWWVFAELSRRMGLPLFGSPRRDAELRQGQLDDDVIAASMAAPARRPAPAPRPRPGRAGRPVHRPVARARRPRRRPRARQPAHGRPVQLTGRAPGAGARGPRPPRRRRPPWPAGRRPGQALHRVGVLRRAGSRDRRDRSGRGVVPARLPVGERQPAHDGRRRSAQRHADPVRLRRRALRAPHDLTVASSASSTMPTTVPG
jgi:anaerobic selenocysteine-containing dehydrogenase